MFYIIAFILNGILLYLLTWFLPPDCPWSFWWRTDKKAARAAARLANIKKTDVVYELGSGDGEFAVTIAKEFGAHVVGIEIDFLRFYISKLRAFLTHTNDRVQFIRSDFKKINLSESTVVYFYLVPGANKRILPKLKKELKKGTRVISYRFKVPELKQTGFDKQHIYYLYTI